MDFVICSLHDALVEEAFDKLENNFSEVQKVSKYKI